ncbi:MAG: patatin-like phospholipase family protein, partial [Nitrospirae bacterium]|nr:patatin-like phospholipase family protein [Nitrospirota bacterium]
MLKRPRVGIALSGGAARCIAHIGVLEVLESEGIGIDLIAGTSGGALVGALYASGHTLREMLTLAFKLSWRGMVKPSFSRQGLIANKNLLKFITQKIGQKDFKDLKIPLAVV